MDIWVVGQNKSNEGSNAWEYQGVFDSLEGAIKACIAPNYFYFPHKLNTEVNKETIIIDVVYPMM